MTMSMSSIAWLIVELFEVIFWTIWIFEWKKMCTNVQFLVWFSILFVFQLICWYPLSYWMLISVKVQKSVYRLIGNNIFYSRYLTSEKLSAHIFKCYQKLLPLFFQQNFYHLWNLFRIDLNKILLCYYFIEKLFSDHRCFAVRIRFNIVGFSKKRILQIDNLRHDLKMFEYHVGGMNNSHADCRCAFCRSGHRYSDAKTENVLNTKRDGTIVVLYGRKYYI